MEGVRLCCRYSLITNKLGFCGPPGAAEGLRRFILGDDGEAARLLTRFEALYPYLEIISKRHGLQPFDPDVVEAYWIGNELSRGYGERDLTALLSLLGKRGLPESIRDELLKNPPRTMPLTHNFHVLYVGPGRTTGSLPSTVGNMDKCMISCGRVDDVTDDHATVVRRELLLEDGFLLSEPREKKILFDPELLFIKEGDYVSIHWDHAVEVLAKTQKKNLERLTLEAIGSVSPSN